MARAHTPEAEILRQIAPARRRDARERAAGRRAVGATYDRGTGRIMIELTSGYCFGFPASAIPALAGATPAQLAAVDIGAGGGALRWDAIDVDLSVPGLLLSALGRSQQLRELARIAGQSTSDAKAAAARANGAKGGRPRRAAGG